MERLTTTRIPQWNRLVNDVAEAFMENGLFETFGPDPKKKYRRIRRYMKVYLETFVRCGFLYRTSPEMEGIMGLAQEHELPRVRASFFLPRILLSARPSVMLAFLQQAGQVKSVSDFEFHTGTGFLEVLILCVRKPYQNQGHMRRMLDYAKDRASALNKPLLLDTDVLENQRRYQHLGFETYATQTTTNGITRYNMRLKGAADAKDTGKPS